MFDLFSPIPAQRGDLPWVRGSMGSDYLLLAFIGAMVQSMSAVRSFYQLFSMDESWTNRQGIGVV